MTILFAIAYNVMLRMCVSMRIWLVTAISLCLSAVFFYVLLARYVKVSAQPQFSRGVTEVVVASVLQFDAFLLLFISPLVTMGLFTDERRLGTIKLLMSSPLSTVQHVLGKYLGIAVFYVFLIVLFSLLPLSLLFSVDLDLGQFFAGVSGLVLLTSSFIAIGLFMSALTESPPTAGVSTFGVLLMLWLAHSAAGEGTSKFAWVFSYLSLSNHYENLLSGVFSSVDVIYFLLLDSLFIALTILYLSREPYRE